MSLYRFCSKELNIMCQGSFCECSKEKRNTDLRDMFNRELRKLDND